MTCTAWLIQNRQHTLPSIRGSLMCVNGCRATPKHRDPYTGYSYCQECSQSGQPLDLSNIQRSLYHRPSTASSTSDAASTGSDSPRAYSRVSSPSSTPSLTPRALSSTGRRLDRRPRAASRCTICHSNNCTDNQHRADRKKTKERANRGALQISCQLSQDRMVCYGNLLDGNRQSSGNQHTSGLKVKKIDTLMQEAAVSIGLFDKLYKKCHRERNGRPIHHRMPRPR